MEWMRNRFESEKSRKTKYKVYMEREGSWKEEDARLLFAFPDMEEQLYSRMD